MIAEDRERRGPVLAEMCRQMELPDTPAVICAGYEQETLAMVKLNVGLTSRFPQHNRVVLPQYTPEEMALLAVKFASNEGQTVSHRLRRRLPDVMRDRVSRCAALLAAQASAAAAPPSASRWGGIFTSSEQQEGQRPAGRCEVPDCFRCQNARAIRNWVKEALIRQAARVANADEARRELREELKRRGGGAPAPASDLSATITLMPQARRERRLYTAPPAVTAGSESTVSPASSTPDETALHVLQAKYQRVKDRCVTFEPEDFGLGPVDESSSEAGWEKLGEAEEEEKASAEVPLQEEAEKWAATHPEHARIAAAMYHLRKKVFLMCHCVFRWTSTTEDELTARGEARGLALLQELEEMLLLAAKKTGEAAGRRAVVAFWDVVDARPQLHWSSEAARETADKAKQAVRGFKKALQKSQTRRLGGTLGSDTNNGAVVGGGAKGGKAPAHSGQAQPQEQRLELSSSERLAATEEEKRRAVELAEAQARCDELKAEWEASDKQLHADAEEMRRAYEAEFSEVQRKAYEERQAAEAAHALERDQLCAAKERELRAAVEATHEEAREHEDALRRDLAGVREQLAEERSALRSWREAFLGLVCSVVALAAVVGYVGLKVFGSYALLTAGLPLVLPLALLGLAALALLYLNPKLLLRLLALAWQAAMWLWRHPGAGLALLAALILCHFALGLVGSTPSKLGAGEGCQSALLPVLLSDDARPEEFVRAGVCLDDFASLQASIATALGRDPGARVAGIQEIRCECAGGCAPWAAVRPPPSGGSLAGLFSRDATLSARFDSS